jgi:hypothetical protein
LPKLRVFLGFWGGWDMWQFSVLAFHHVRQPLQLMRHQLNVKSFEWRISVLLEFHHVLGLKHVVHFQPFVLVDTSNSLQVIVSALFFFLVIR